jgi:hypothetical protein
MGGRGLIRLKYVHAFRDRMGRMRYYFRRHGKRNALPGLPGSSEFMAAYAAQLNDSSSQAKPSTGPRQRQERSLLSQSAITARRNSSPYQLQAAVTIAASSTASSSSMVIVASTK